ncbi:poly adp-ribose glycohydrolase [Holotrichia oblita]|uniref:Poly adp-ribose glycohydrolase n=1 Tax=Holotrichia oblita TaxID=644536 RepID=A0ACB9SUY5_HOLOL|nr:poly adp-ribose glycohydrolase [Holotrichia oblita]
MATNKTWSGTSIDDLYENSGPYSFVYPPVTPSKNHAVLYELPVTLNSPPKPHRSSQTHHWEDNYVKLPYSPQNVFPIENNETGEKILKSRWEIIENSLLQPIKSSHELEAAIKCYNTRLSSFAALHYFFEEVLDEEEGEAFFKTLLPGIVRLALKLPEILPGNLPLLQKQKCSSISLSQLQIASLLANGFLCTFPWRKDVCNTYPGLNFASLTYILAPVGTVTFERKYLQKNQFPRWDKIENNLGNTKVHICSSETIENGHGLLQVDFANKFVGGGVLGYGCVQEEIRFIICPELIVSRLFTEELNSSEALVIIGAERYSNYSGYGDTFAWEGDYQDQTPYDCYGRRKVSILAIDAIKFNKASEQFSTSHMLRELNKAYVGFHSNLTGKLAPVATGNWGCGAFRGDPSLKSLIQLMACSAAKRYMVYYTFGDTDLEKTIYNLYTFIGNNKVTISELWRILCRFVVSNSNQNNFIPYIQQAYFDLHNQPTITQFFSTNSTNNSKNSNSTQPSTSFKNSKKSPTKNDKVRETATVTSTSAEVLHKTTSLTKHEAREDEIDTTSDEDNSESILDLIRIIDGDVDDKNKEDPNEQSLLSSIDKFSKIKERTTSDCVKTGESVAIDMDVDEINSEKQKVVSKRKISDYFVKVTK